MMTEKRKVTEFDSVNFKEKTDCGAIYLQINKGIVDEKIKPYELTSSKGGSCLRSRTRDYNILINLLIERGVSRLEIANLLIKNGESCDKRSDWCHTCGQATAFALIESCCDEDGLPDRVEKK